MLDQKERWAIFWCSLLSPVLYGEIPQAEVGRFIADLISREHLFPDGRRRRPSRATLWRKWKLYRDGGFDALLRKRRNDRGQPRKATPAMIAKAVELKTEQPYRSDVPLNQFLQSEFGTTVPKSTLYRHLKRAGATRLKLGISQRKVRRRWTRDHSNDLWLGDFEDGPCVLVGDQAVPTHLSAFIDCHSRYVVEARYYLRENLDILTDSLLRAWAAHGASRELYLDNAKIYHSHALKARHHISRTSSTASAVESARISMPRFSTVALRAADGLLFTPIFFSHLSARRMAHSIIHFMPVGANGKRTALFRSHPRFSASRCTLAAVCWICWRFSAAVHRFILVIQLPQPQSCVTS